MKNRAAARNARNVKSLMRLFDEKEIRSCELRLLDVCKGTFALSFAHRHKRRWYLGRQHLLKDFSQVVLACGPCHERIEKDAKLTKEMFVMLRGPETND